MTVKRRALRPAEPRDDRVESCVATDGVEPRIDGDPEHGGIARRDGVRETIDPAIEIAHRDIDIRLVGLVEGEVAGGKFPPQC